MLCTYSFISDVWLLLARSSADTDTQSSAWCLYLGEWKPWPLALEDRAKEVSSVSLTSSFMVFDGSEVPSSWSYGRMQKYPFPCRGSGYTSSWICKLSKRPNPVKCLCRLSCIKYCSSHLIYLRKVKGSVTLRLESVCQRVREFFKVAVLCLSF